MNHNALRAAMRDAVRIAITRCDLKWEEETEWTEDSIAEDAVQAAFGESSCDDEPIESVKQALAASEPSADSLQGTASGGPKAENGVGTDSVSKAPRPAPSEAVLLFSEALKGIDAHLILAVNAAKRGEHTDAFEHCCKAQKRVDDALAALAARQGEQPPDWCTCTLLTPTDEHPAGRVTKSTCKVHGRGAVKQREQAKESAKEIK